MSNFLRDGFMRAAKSVSKAGYPSFYLADAESHRYQPSDFSKFEKQAELYNKLSWVNVAVTQIATIGAGVTMNVKKLEKEKETDIVNHDFERLMRRPNEVDSGYEFLFNTLAYLTISRRAFWWLNKVGVNPTPTEMWNVPSNQIAPILDGSMGISGYSYDSGAGHKLIIPKDQIVYFKGFDPLNQFSPSSPAEAVAMVAQGDIGMQRWNTQLFRGNARLPGVMAFADMINDGEWEQMQDDVDSAANNRNIMMLRNVKAGGVQWIQAAASQKDMEFLQGRKANRDEIWNVYAPGLVSMLSENATEANSRTGKAVLIDQRVYPLLKSVAATITAKIMPLYGDDLVVEPDDIRVTDRQLELMENQEYSKTHTIDEIRAEYWKDKPLGDERGKLLPAEIAKPSIKEDVTAQQAMQAELGQGVSHIPQAAGGVPQADLTSQVQPVKADIRPALTELDKWEKKFAKTGKREWEACNIPAYIADAVKTGTMDFEGARAALKSNNSETLALVEAVNKLAEQLCRTQK